MTQQQHSMAMHAITPHSTGWHSKSQKLAAAEQLGPNVEQSIPAGYWDPCQGPPAEGRQWGCLAWPVPWMPLLPRSAHPTDIHHILTCVPPQLPHTLLAQI